jgi:hypothetical protein
LAQKFVTKEIPAFQLREGDVIHLSPKAQARVEFISRYSKHAPITSVDKHSSCRGIHINGRMCWDLDVRLTVTRPVPTLAQLHASESAAWEDYAKVHGVNW